MNTSLHKLDPLTDERWATFIATRPGAGVFHTVGWMRALKDTYGYEPVVYTTTPPGRDLTNGIPFTEIRSWISGRRLVSLPFSDHCLPLMDGTQRFEELCGLIAEEARGKSWRYVELRPAASAENAVEPGGPFRAHDRYYLNTVDLTPDLNTLRRSFHKSCVQRVIRRAEREAVTIDAGRSPEHLKAFYSLLVQTRRRHRLPPQPIKWFSNLIHHMGDALTIRIALKDGNPIAAILTFHYKDVLTYKYGCSDSRHSHLGGTCALFWDAIQEAKSRGAVSFDLGRSDTDNEGLITFKDRWGSKRTELKYFRFSTSPASTRTNPWPMRIAKTAFSHMPDSLLTLAGRALYRHTG